MSCDRGNTAKRVRGAVEEALGVQLKSDTICNTITTLEDGESRGKWVDDMAAASAARAMFRDVGIDVETDPNAAALVSDFERGRLKATPKHIMAMRSNIPEEIRQKATAAAASPPPPPSDGGDNGKPKPPSKPPRPKKFGGYTEQQVAEIAENLGDGSKWNLSTEEVGEMLAAGMPVDNIQSLNEAIHGRTDWGSYSHFKAIREAKGKKDFKIAFDNLISGQEFELMDAFRDGDEFLADLYNSPFCTRDMKKQIREAAKAHIDGQGGQPERGRNFMRLIGRD